MKKLLCGALMLLTAATAFVGCDKDKNKEITSITLNKSELTLAKGASQRLSVSANDKLQGTYTWASSDEQVATVDKYGTVTAQNIGTVTITVTETTSKQTATCAVKVISQMEAIVFDQATVSYYNSPEYLATLDTIDSVFTATNAAGEIIYLRGFYVDATVNIYSEGFYVNNDYELDGVSEGYIASFPAKSYYAPAGMNSDRGFNGVAVDSRGAWTTKNYGQVAKNGKSKTHALQAGYLDNDNVTDAFEHVKAAVEYRNARDMDMYAQELGIADTMAFKGGFVRKYTYYPQANDYYTTYFPTAIPTACDINIAGWNGELDYMQTLGSSRMTIIPLGGTDGMGFAYEVDEVLDEWILNSETFLFEQAVKLNYTSNAEVPARMVMNKEQFDQRVLTINPIEVRRVLK